MNENNEINLQLNHCSKCNCELWLVDDTDDKNNILCGECYMKIWRKRDKNEN